MSTSELSPAAAERLLAIKQDIASSFPDFKENLTKAWGAIITELEVVTKEIEKAGPEYIPQINFADLDAVPAEVVAEIKTKGSVVIHDVVEDAQAITWKDVLEEFIKANPDVEGNPVNNKQFFQLYWTKAQVQARAHPNLLKASAWLNNLYHERPGTPPVEGVDLSVPLTYADRFRIRRPGVLWNEHPPHIDGGSIERWEDKEFRKVFADILSGNWKKHDPYDITGRVNAKTSLDGRPNQSSVFRTFQGWLAMSETAPTEGTLRVFPNLHLSNAYLIARPFFKPLVSTDSSDIFDPKNWEYDISDPQFHGIWPRDGGFAGPRPTPVLHPHLQLETTMTSVPKVHPGDMVFWHCDVVHSVELEHTGKGDSAVMYIPAVPMTPLNYGYVERQKACFLDKVRPPDFPKGVNEQDWVGVASQDDILNPVGRRAMGFQADYVV